jgi:hypothetical protein
MLSLLSLSLIALLFLVLAFINHRRHKHQHVFEPLPSFPLIGTLYIELISNNRIFESATRFLKHALRPPTSKRVYTENVPGLGRCLVVADFKEVSQLLKDMGNSNALLQRDRTVHTTYQRIFKQSLQNSFGDDWAWRRKVLSPHFTGSKLQGNFGFDDTKS